MMSEEVSTIPTTQVVTPELVVASINRARRSLEAAAEEIVWQIEVEGWHTLGYPSWSAMREAEYGGAAFMVPSKSRPEIVARIKEIEVGRTARGDSKHLTNQEIAETVGVSERQVKYDLAPDNKKGSSAPFVDDDILDAEIVEDDNPGPTEPAPRQQPVTPQFTATIVDINKALTKLTRITEHPNYPNNRDTIAELHRSDLNRAINTLQNILTNLN